VRLIKRFDVARCGRGQDRNSLSVYLLQISAVHLVMVSGLQFDDAGRVEAQRRSFPSSQPRATGLLAYRGTI